MVATASLSGPSVRATMATSAPEAANRVATAKPIPLLPPVTMAVRPERLISIVFLEKARRDDRADFDFATPSDSASGSAVSLYHKLRQPAAASGLLGPRHRPRRALHAQRQNPVQQVAIFDAVVLGGCGKFLAFGDLGVRIGFEEIWHTVGRQPEIDAGIAVELQR